MADKKLIEVDESTTIADDDKIVGNIGSAVKQITLANLVTIIKNKIGSLKNPNALTFTGAVNETYDGSEAKTVNIPDLSSYQTKIDNSLNTMDKTITGAINENAASISELKSDIGQLSDDVNELKNNGTGTGWTTAQINLLDSLFSYIAWTNAGAGSIADTLIVSLKSTASNGDSSGDTSEDDITQSGSTLIITSLANEPTLNGSVLVIE